MQPTLLLASKSPRRRQLLSQLGYPVLYVDIDVDEKVSPNTPVELVSANLAILKSNAYSKKLLDNEILVTADTIVAHNGKILGKPHDAENAKQILQSLSGDKHSVYTGVCLKSNSRQVVFTEHTIVFFKQLNNSEIDNYISQGTCFDKAGAYGIQEWIGMIGVQRIEGCYYNVMGLPLASLYRHLQQIINKS